MNTIKKFNRQDSDKYIKYRINGEHYRAYKIGDLPAKFGCIKWNKNVPITKDSYPSEGICSWWKDNKKGLIFVSEGYFPKWG